MRVSTDSKDAGYNNYLHLNSYGVSVQVVFNYNILDDVITADEELGYILYCPQPDKCDVDGKLVTKEYFGKVEIKQVPSLNLVYDIKRLTNLNFGYVINNP